MSAGIDELIGRLRNNEIGLRYISANEIMSEAADTIERLQLDLAVLKEQLEDEHSRKKEWQQRARAAFAELNEANEAKRNVCRLLDQALAQLDARQSQG